MIDAKNYRALAQLKDNTPVVVRAITPGDRDRFVAAFKALGPESIYSRFFSYKKWLTDDDLRQFIEVDFDRTVALVVEAGDDDGGYLIGGGRYVRPQDRRTANAELAFITGETHRGQGVASTILQHLVLIGRDHGVRIFEADVLAHNQSMLSVFRRCGASVSMETGGNIIRVTLA